MAEDAASEAVPVPGESVASTWATLPEAHVVDTFRRISGFAGGEFERIALHRGVIASQRRVPGPCGTGFGAPRFDLSTAATAILNWVTGVIPSVLPGRQSGNGEARRTDLIFSSSSCFRALGESVEP